MISAAKARALRARTALHRTVFEASRGRLMRRWGGLPALMVTTVGRVSGQPRRTMLVTPYQDSRGMVLVASNGGADAHPQWYRNLTKTPEVLVLMSGRRRQMRARTATSAEKAAIWPQIVSRSPSYGRYQERTERDIPLVVLEPSEVPPA